MISSSNQPVHRGFLTLPSSSALDGWSSYSGNRRGRRVVVNVCVRTFQEQLSLTEEKERTRSVKDVWRSKRNGGQAKKCSEAAESTSYVGETVHKDRPLDPLTFLATNPNLPLSIRNEFSLANVGGTTLPCDTSEKNSKRNVSKKPSQLGKDVWRSGSKLLAEEQLADKSELATSSNKYTSARSDRSRSVSGKNVWRGRKSDDGPAMNIQSSGNTNKSRKSRKRLYLVDVHPLCYNGSKVQPRKVIEWMTLLFSEVVQDNPIIAVMDGERGNEYRRALLPSYKAKRNFYRPLGAGYGHSSAANDLRKALPLIHGFLSLCHIPVVKQEFAEADDVIATLARQARHKGFQVVIASPDMDFQQLLTPDVHMLLPVPELGRWSFFTLQNYVAQNTATPDLELGLKCLLGDVSDNVPGLPDVSPGFGKNTALKLMLKHGSLENLLAAAATRTVGREYIQDALKKHENLLRRNLQVLSLRTDVDVVLEEEWCRSRCIDNDILALQLLNERLRSR
ncbi:uncharacterized protein [Physcomitrium patens]|uniref:5'-3' exonuclease domain-containing protein n=1 Tax=Physcomitrium patens TaxID=3218 RepID=A0A2K1L9D0_PHYPA|nr:uncharacterized protein LOC112287574 [Physcomitrium patens]XP_024386457.1 uncharacterized protein LOC112287574 [Physcomitrium patens]XP_024386468.1 uncharacterized protein LOC112287574 [Physcomitrium patens]PNR62646.1 hypothetical protein PHYPA_001070 [Physcomitrium patens]|eukprot:XP_024386451.1 uncharacterized protein LOC112287574 [Physcomitrella patens]